jgi:hypothetical protein
MKEHVHDVEAEPLRNLAELRNVARLFHDASEKTGYESACPWQAGN